MGSITYLMQQRGPASEFVGRLSQAHGAALQRFLLRMLGSRELAEEVAQETYLKLYRLCRPEDVVCPQALLFDVATKLALTHLRRARAQAVIAASTVELEDMPDEAAQPDQRAMADEAMRWLEKIIEELPPKLRQVFIMRYVQQLPRPEIADSLGISVGALEQRLTRALAHCRERLSSLGLSWPGFD